MTRAPEVAARMRDIYRQMSPAQKMRHIAELCEAMCRMTLARLRLRYPEADERELGRRLMERMYGEAFVTAVYGEAAPR